MFFDNLVKLCVENNTTPNAVCIAVGLSEATQTKWRKGAVPRDTTLKRIADYFGVSIDYLVGNSDVPTQKEKPTDEGRLTENEVVYSRNGKTTYNCI